MWYSTKFSKGVKMNLPTSLDTSDFMAVAGLVVVALAAFWSVRKALALLGR